MNIKDLFRQLSYGELSNLSIGGSGSGEIKADKYPQLVHYLNDGLIALYTRFVLSEKELLVEMVENITQYHLRLKYTESAGEEGEPDYIKDDGNPFLNDLVRVLSVWDGDGCQFVLNDVENCNSLFTPTPDTIQVPEPADGEILAVVYQARPPKLTDVADGEADILDQEFELPIILENALRQYIAHKVFFHIGGQENLIKAQNYLGTYEAICLDVEQRDLVNQSIHTSHAKLEQRGFV
jgi:hypothetical protein